MSTPAEVESAPSTTLYVLIPPSPLFAAHWSLFLPDMRPYNTVSRRYEESHRGRRMHVSGDRLNGFALEVIREYDIKKHTSVGSRRFAIGAVPAHCLRSIRPASHNSKAHRSKDEDEGGGWVDNDPIDEFERLLVAVEAPGPSLNSASSGHQPRRKPTDVKDCQWWVKEVVRKLLNSGALQTIGEEAPDMLTAKLPAH